MSLWTRGVILSFLSAGVICCGGTNGINPGAMATADQSLASASQDGDDDQAPPDEKGAFTSDFVVPGSFPAGELGPVIERDRMYMTARPGFHREFTPVALDDQGNFLTGGRYQFESLKRAEEYGNWVATRFVLDGTVFVDRPYILNHEFHAWSLIGAEDFADFHTHQLIVRLERFSIPEHGQRRYLKAVWPAVRDAAKARGLTSVWLLYSKREHLAGLVYFADRVVPANPSMPDFASLGALASAPALGDVIATEGWTRIFDRTQWVLNIWTAPFILGDHGEASIWPYSPPFPAPYAGDGVCEVNLGENSVNAPQDCLPTCGNGVADPGENTLNCPGDVRPFKDTSNP